MAPRPLSQLFHRVLGAVRGTASEPAHEVLTGVQTPDGWLDAVHRLLHEPPEGPAALEWLNVLLDRAPGPLAPMLNTLVGTDRSRLPRDGATAMHQAVASGRPDLLLRLARVPGVDPNARADAPGEDAPLEQALTLWPLERRTPDLIAALLIAGARVDGTVNMGTVRDPAICSVPEALVYALSPALLSMAQERCLLDVAELDQRPGGALHLAVDAAERAHPSTAASLVATMTWLVHHGASLDHLDGERLALDDRLDSTAARQALGNAVAQDALNAVHGFHHTVTVRQTIDDVLTELQATAPSGTPAEGLHSLDRGRGRREDRGHHVPPASRLGDALDRRQWMTESSGSTPVPPGAPSVPGRR